MKILKVANANTAQFALRLFPGARQLRTNPIRVSDYTGRLVPVWAIVIPETSRELTIVRESKYLAD